MRFMTCGDGNLGGATLVFESAASPITCLYRLTFFTSRSGPSRQHTGDGDHAVRVRCQRFARRCRVARRHHDRGGGVTVSDRAIDAVMVVGAVTGERDQGRIHLFQQRVDLEASSTSFVVSVAATISPVSASMPI